jgi:magnesium transporter
MPKRETKYEHFSWIDIINPAEEELSAIASEFNLSKNLLKDSLQFGHLPKMEKQGDYLFLILRAYSAELHDLATTVGELSNKIAFFISPNQLITIHRADFEFLSLSQMRIHSSEQLVLHIIEKMLHTFEAPLKAQSDKMDFFERQIFLHKGSKMEIKDLYFQKSKARISKKVLVFTQNTLQQLIVSQENASTLQDLKEKITALLLHYDEVNEDAQSLLNSYLSVSAQNNNDIMKLLTVFSAFFLPLTFLAGIYGMNFAYMPELQWKYGYLIIILLMVLLSSGIYFWFKKKRIL